MLAAPTPPVSFRRSAAPRASIIIPSLGDPNLLGRCLEALHRHIGLEVPHQIIVHVNRADPEALHILRTQTSGIEIIAASVNRGFGGACNHAAAAARGELLVFLNDDAEVQPGWLEELLETADRHPEAGAVGSLVARPDGTIQEVGSFVWRDGSTFAVGRGLEVEANPHPAVRAVEFCSACSLLVRKDLWAAVGGFDERYHPAYYEDVDLCFTLRRLGRHVLCQPRSRVVHHESSSTRADYREFLMRRNRLSFVEKWATDLAGRELVSPAAIAQDRSAVRAIEERLLPAAGIAANHTPNEPRGLPSDRAYVERELLLKSEFLAELEAKLTEAERRARDLVESEAQLRELVAALKSEQSEYAAQVEALKTVFRQPRHRLVERLNSALKRKASLVHRALKSLLRSHELA